MLGHNFDGGVVSKLLMGLALLVGVSVTYGILLGFYNVFLHPLRSYPGPLLWRAWRWQHTLSTLKGNYPFDSLALHKRYGPVVRVAPDELSYTDSNALKAIYGHHNPATEGFSEFGKNPMEFNKPASGSWNILTSLNSEDHGRYRKLFSHSFSERGMREMQPRIQDFVTQLIYVLKESAGKGWIDMQERYNWTTFDMIGDLAFGDSFHCLENQKTSPWIAAIFGNMKAAQFLVAIRHYGLSYFLRYLTPKRLMELRATNLRYATEKMEKRIEMGPGQGDFFDTAIANSDFEKGTGMTRGEMTSNASVLVLAGSETTATLLGGTTYLLCKHPDVLKKINDEVREAFKSDEEIDLLSVSKLDYMLAILDEALRIYPPAPNTGCRVVPKGGAIVAGKWVPGGTCLRNQPYAANHSPDNFHRPDDFCPERWQASPPADFANDDRAARVPFSLGPRNCIGRNLAYAEMRLILAKVLWNFDLELDESRCGSWMESQKIFFLWEKPPLWVKLTAVKR
ncbi:cytochrome P450 [Lophiotrema nucula]|uniref:Cytochrome P450 n=1 Tax=Lophiotrema nucula TaxID=690887 RepID=A0A6A5ZEK5_9PLEO|nr:cytochrome P450 [Lophiotrema nucula]